MIGPGKKTLCYCSPAHGGWGIVRTAMLVPESYQLFVCPFACGRHGAIGALTHNNKERLSYLYIDETDIVSGSYEDLILEAVDELFAVLDKRPKALFIIVSCLDDLLGTDHEAFLSVLRAKYPDVHFTEGHMNPITLGSPLPPPVHIQCKMYGLLQPSTHKDRAVNLIGNNVVIDPDAEIYQLLKNEGYAIRQLPACSTYDEFQQLARSALNIVLRPPGLRAAKDMNERLGIDYLYLPVTYRFEEIDRSYHLISQALFGGKQLSLNPYRQKAESAVHKAKCLLQNTALSTDSSATIRPFSLARMLVEYGFSVQSIFAQECIGIEEESSQWLKENTQVEVIDPSRYDAPIKRNAESPLLSLGFESSYYMGASHVLPLIDDETLYGYHGVEKLMGMILNAAEKKADVQQLIEDFGLVV